MIFRILPGSLAIGLAALCSACASMEAGEGMARPGKYRFYNCEELTARGVQLLQREKELRDLMARARQGPGGEVAVALAYQTEFNTTLGDIKELESTGTQKNCTLKHRSVSDQVVR